MDFSFYTDRRKLILSKSPFKISRIDIEGRLDNTFILALAEYKHGNNEFLLKE